jgi:hypothetical protein
MRVKICNRCPYTARDLAGHYDPEAVLYACAKCDGAEGSSSQHDPSETQWRRKCATSLSKPSPTVPSAAPFATGNLALSGTIHGEPRSVQPGALATSRRVGSVTKNGCGDFVSPDDRPGERGAAMSALPFPDEEPA